MPRNAKASADHPSGNKRKRTRAMLIQAAAAVIGEKGYDRASLEEIAARAGMTRAQFTATSKVRKNSSWRWSQTTGNRLFPR